MAFMSLQRGSLRLRSIRANEPELAKSLAEDMAKQFSWFPSLEFIQRLLSSESGFGYVIESSQQPHEPILASGFSVFTNSAYSVLAKNLANVGQTTLAVHLLEQLSQWLVNPDELDLCNSSCGVTIVGFGARTARTISSELENDLAHLWQLSLLHVHRGLNIREFMYIAANQNDLPFLQDAGAKPQDPMPALRSPYLMVVSRCDQLNGKIFSLLFDYHPCKLHLTAHYREFLSLALEGFDDPEIAGHLCISEAGVKKRWRALFEIVSAEMPTLLPGPSANGKRGAEKRTLLLRYLDHHPEELQPNRRLAGATDSRQYNVMVSSLAKPAQ